ncbi:hypothetical protein DFJ74DRAFT_662976 [Hyaloraphidium curvatum]|nr:hypothetical protein DFJ74DRAFT_662976 [Hyaloraphidium curvatum]
MPSSALFLALAALFFASPALAGIEWVDLDLSNPLKLGEHFRVPSLLPGSSARLEDFAGRKFDLSAIDNQWRDDVVRNLRASTKAAMLPLKFASTGTELGLFAHRVPVGAMKDPKVKLPFKDIFAPRARSTLDALSLGPYTTKYWAVLDSEAWTGAKNELVVLSSPCLTSMGRAVDLTMWKPAEARADGNAGIAAAEMVARIAVGLAFINQNDLVHGDLRPKNVLVCGDRLPRIGKAWTALPGRSVRLFLRTAGKEGAYPAYERRNIYPEQKQLPDVDDTDRMTGYEVDVFQFGELIAGIAGTITANKALHVRAMKLADILRSPDPLFRPNTPPELLAAVFGSDFFLNSGSTLTLAQAIDDGLAAAERDAMATCFATSGTWLCRKETSEGLFNCQNGRDLLQCAKRDSAIPRRSGH